ncbi:MAG: hypothetical protein LBQ50_08055, partial [Planctomycetaceae bacterium]|nr:hypothetical protein [Planctomycetaceae bacterium]
TETCEAIAFAIKNRQSIAQLIEELPQRTCRTKTINPSCYKTKRYTLKRNPIRATEISDNRKSKLSRLKEIINNSNDYLKNYSPNLMALLFDNEFGVQWDRKTAAKANTII